MPTGGPAHLRAVGGAGVLLDHVTSDMSLTLSVLSWSARGHPPHGVNEQKARRTGEPRDLGVQVSPPWPWRSSRGLPSPRLEADPCPCRGRAVQWSRQPDRSPRPQAGGPRSSVRASVSSSVGWGNIRACASGSGVPGPEWGWFRPAAVVLGDKVLGTQRAGHLCLPALSQLWALTPTPTP